MVDARSYFLSQFLPNRSNHERELILRKNKNMQKFLEIMKEYAREVVEECEGEVVCWDEIAIEVGQKLPGDISPRAEEDIDNIIKGQYRRD